MIRFDSERMDHRLRLAAVVAIGILPLLPSITSQHKRRKDLKVVMACGFPKDRESSILGFINTATHFQFISPRLFILLYDIIFLFFVQILLDFFNGSC
jgi:hypothetical protein